MKTLQSLSLAFFAILLSAASCSDEEITPCDQSFELTQNSNVWINTKIDELAILYGDVSQVEQFLNGQDVYYVLIYQDSNQSNGVGYKYYDCNGNQIPVFNRIAYPMLNLFYVGDY